SHVPWERRDWSEFHRQQSTSTNLERLEVCQATCRGNGATGQNSIQNSPQVRTSSDLRFAMPRVVGTRLYA
ncbi:hypothetical protein AVEN_20821-1, partial [Araneus ventricosus]